MYVTMEDIIIIVLWVLYELKLIATHMQAGELQAVPGEVTSVQSFSHTSTDKETEANGDLLSAYQSLKQRLRLLIPNYVLSCYPQS